MRVVLDTNIIVFGILSPSGAARALLDLARGGRIEVVTSLVLLDELEEVLARFFSSSVAAEIRSAFEEIAQIVRPSQVAAVSRDSDDDQVLAAATAGTAAYIVTRDQGLLTLGEHAGIEIVEPAVVLRTIRAALEADDGGG